MPSTKTQKYVFAFEEGGKEQKFLLGGKGANLAEMTHHRPPGTARLHDHDRGVQRLHGRRQRTSRRPHGRGRRRARGRSRRRWASSSAPPSDPLLVSVRSGAPFSMPGMMDTVLNLGLNDESVRGLAAADRQRALRATTPTAASCRCSARSCSTFQAITSRRRCTSCVESKGFDRRHRAERRGPARARRDVQGDRARRRRASTFPTTPPSSCATRSRPCSSRGTASARCDYRKFEGIADDLGTAVNVQAMVFGNKGDDSGTGVAFTRNPSTGENSALRRLPEERAGRRRRGRHPDHRAARRDAQRDSPSRTSSCLA